MLPLSTTFCALTPEESQRYERHLQLPGFGAAGQQKLKAARVLILGAGGLGCPIGLYLAAAGVGVMGVADDDTVALSNLQRQIAHQTQGIGLLKTDSLVAAMSAINPLLSYQAHPERITAETIASLLDGYDLIIDGTDNFSTRFLVADACHLLNKPLLSGAIHQFSAQIFLSVPGQTPCYRCLYRTPPTQNAALSCTDAGVLGVLPGTVGVMMATEAIKFLTEIGTGIGGRLLVYDALAPSLRQWPYEKDQDCPLCGPSATIRQIQETPAYCASQNPQARQVSIHEAIQQLEAGAFLVDVREAFEFEQGHLPNAFSLPLSQLNSQTASALPKDKTLLLYCAKGARSLQALDILHSLGMSRTVGLAGGLQAWKEAES